MNKNTGAMFYDVYAGSDLRTRIGGFDDTKLDAKFVNIIKTLSSETHTENEGVREINLSSMDTREKVDALPDPNIDYDFSEPMTAIIYNKLNISR